MEYLVARLDPVARVFKYVDSSCRSQPSVHLRRARAPDFRHRPADDSRTPIDIFPNINIPIVTAVWQYRGMPAEEISNRIVANFERGLTTTVNDIEHIESQSLRGISVVKVFLQPGAKTDQAIAQIAAVAQFSLRQMPPGTQPPFIITFNASTVPVLQLALSGAGLSEQQLSDTATNFLRPQLSTVQGAQIPQPYGGKQAQVQVDLNLAALQAKSLSATDVVNAISAQNLILPGGTSKIGDIEYDVSLNGSTQTIDELNDLPIKTVDGAPIYIRDVAHVRNGYPPQTNIVRVNGQRSVLMTVQKTGDVSTLDVIARIKEAVARIAARPAAGLLEIDPLGDQSVFVRAAITGVVREAVIAACLTAVMILVFLGSWRSTIIIAVSIPLSILSSIIALSALGETINIMTLGGLALAVGILVDDATVAIENISTQLEQGSELEPAILEGPAQIAVPSFVSTLCICIVFVPMFFLTGVARYLFVPMAEAVVFAMMASYVLSRTLVPTHGEVPAEGAPAGRPRRRAPPAATVFPRLSTRSTKASSGCATAIADCSQRSVERRRSSRRSSWRAASRSLLLIRWVGQDFFPSVDSGQFKLHVRGPTGQRIEETAAMCDRIDQFIRELIPAARARRPSSTTSACPTAA